MNSAKIEFQVEEVTVWRTSDGQSFDVRDTAWNHQERINFLHWCEGNICVGGEWTALMVANAILEVWKVEPREGK